MWLDMVDGGYKSFLYSVLSRDKWVCSEISSHVMMCYCAKEKKSRNPLLDCLRMSTIFAKRNSSDIFQPLEKFMGVEIDKIEVT